MPAPGPAIPPLNGANNLQSSTFFGPGSVSGNSFPLIAAGQRSQQRRQQQLLRCFHMQIQAAPVKEPEAFSPGHWGCARGTGGATGRTRLLNPPRCFGLRANSRTSPSHCSRLWCCPLLPKIKICASCLLLCDSLCRGGSGCLLWPCKVLLSGHPRAV